MSKLAKLREKANRHGINPVAFIIIYFGTLFPSIAAIGWFVSGITDGIPGAVLALRFLIAWVLFQAPSIYIMVFGRGLPWRFELFVASVMVILATRSLGMPGLCAVLLFLLLVWSVKIVQSRKKLPQLVVKSINPMEWIAVISERFIRDYSIPPWDEARRCPLCIPFDDFAGGGTSDEVCAIHGEPTTPYWDHERTAEYIQQAMSETHFACVGLFSASGELEGFSWGFEKEIDGKRTFYIDVIDIEPNVRRSRGDLHGLLLNLMAAWKMRFGLRSSSFVDRMIPVLGFPPVGLLYVGLAAVAHGSFLYVSTRTHIEAKNVRRALRVAGFKESDPDPGTPTRSFHVAMMKGQA